MLNAGTTTHIAAIILLQRNFQQWRDGRIPTISTNSLAWFRTPPEDGTPQEKIQDETSVSIGPIVGSLDFWSTSCNNPKASASTRTISNLAPIIPKLLFPTQSTKLASLYFAGSWGTPIRTVHTMAVNTLTPVPYHKTCFQAFLSCYFTLSFLAALKSVLVLSTEQAVDIITHISTAAIANSINFMTVLPPNTANLSSCLSQF